ncbi:MAG: serine carboxypeptidase [Caldilineaceae bacterium]|nr:serine carboxypeptidase [Caldilineaceae bacterium]MBP8124985.1 serine carboxypeptidase [Caldilineaceae bacterium]
MKQVLVIHLNTENSEGVVSFLGQKLSLLRRGCGGDVAQARQLIADHDGKVDAIGLEGLPAELTLGPAHRPHVLGANLAAAAQQTPVVDGGGIRPGLERWGVILADRAQPGIFAQKRVLMVPGLNHNGLAQSLGRRGSSIRYADPLVYFNLPDLPGVGSKLTLEQAAPATLDQLKDAPFRRILPQAGEPGKARTADPFADADLIAGDVGAIRRYAPASLKRKTIVVEHADEADLADLRKRGAAIVVTMMPSLDESDDLGRWSAATVEAVLVALRPDPLAPLSEDTYLDLMADILWTPAVRTLQKEEAGINRFAFVIHPLSMDFIHNHKAFRWTRFLPDALVEPIAALVPPMYISKITGGVSPTTGQRIEGHLISLGATPRQMMKHDERFTYRQLNQSAKMAERLGARIMGLGAFTSVVGDAGITVAHEADIAITSGNSLTVAATLEAAKQAVIKMGATDLTKGKVMIVGATGSIASVCARLLAQAIHDVVLVSIEPEKLIELKRVIQAETPGCRVTIATKTGGLVKDCDLIVTATSAFGQRVIDVTQCKPGAVICDVARPLDINPAEAALRPDILVIESGEVLIPGEVDFGYNIGLPPKTAYACLGETALLTMDGRFVDYTLGRNIEMERVKEIFRLFKKHGFQLAGLRSFGEYITDEDVARRRALAEKLRQDPDLYRRTVAEAGQKLAKIPVMSKGVGASGGGNGKVKWAGVVAGVGVLAVVMGLRGRGGG